MLLFTNITALFIFLFLGTAQVFGNYALKFLLFQKLFQHNVVLSINSLNDIQFSAAMTGFVTWPPFSYQNN